MRYRPLGRTGIKIAEISLGTWQVGGKWGDPFSHGNADAILNKAADMGVNFFDTADVYMDGESEKAVARLVKSRSEKIYIASKCGKRFNPHTNDNYTVRELIGFVEDSLKRTGLETIDLIQLHCPPSEVYYRPEVFEAFDRLIEQGKIGHLGVSVEKIEHALKAMEYPNVETVQIIFNLFRHRPRELFFEQVSARNIGVIVRVPLASGLLSGKYDKNTTFEPGDHRHDNRQGEKFDRGETFSGVPYNTGVETVQELEDLFPGVPMAQLALRWILMFDEVSCVIPGASKPGQVETNLKATELPPFTEDEMLKIDELYNSRIRKYVHHSW